MTEQPEPLKCTSCGKEMEKAAGRHFYNVFCEKCYYEYKMKNLRICGICGKPLYQCYC